MIELRSDNAAGVAPEILSAVQAANSGSALAYGADDLTAHLQEVVRAVFEHPTARVFPVTGQTYPRKADSQIVDSLSGIAQSGSKLANDLRLLQHEGELLEPFESEQIGSSAMAFL